MLLNHRSNQHECLIVLKYRIGLYPLQHYNHFTRSLREGSNNIEGSA